MRSLTKSVCPMSAEDGSVLGSHQPVFSQWPSLSLRNTTHFIIFAKEITFNITKRDDLSLSRLLCKIFIFDCKYGHFKRSKAKVVRETLTLGLELCFGSFSTSILSSSWNNPEHSFTTAIADSIAVSEYARVLLSCMRMLANSLSTADVSETSFEKVLIDLSAWATVSAKVKSVVLSRSPESATWMIAATTPNPAIFWERMALFIQGDYKGEQNKNKKIEEL